MGLLDDVMGAFGGGDKSGLMGIVMELMKPENGGLQGLVQKFEAAGLQDIVKSWISTGANAEIAPAQVETALGPDLIASLSSQFGGDKSALLAQLSQHLPRIIDMLTPDGAAPEGNALQSQLGAVLGGLFKS
jgi:uncharacterized protein YidB (DUF937 family)